MNISVSLGKVIDGEFLPFPEAGCTSRFGEWSKTEGKAIYKFMSLPRSLKPDDAYAVLVNGEVKHHAPLNLKSAKGDTLTIWFPFG